ncbi:Keratinocyte-associated protein 3 [Acipenser ruthenus]|uniref:Keratinocyte-associated protein 3 n=1 Tax=Acipenser ruthenus TaxID=7906 RepID=A0A444UHE4_ACIRT|nr:Keratinocyte-associated protein 3 [Acipenser ruthenus]
MAMLSCWACRSLVPVCVIMWLGEPRLDTDSSCRAFPVVGRNIFDTFRLGKRRCSLMSFPLESISRATSALCCLLGAVGSLSESLVSTSSWSSTGCQPFSSETCAVDLQGLGWTEGSITTGIIAILVSRNLPNGKLHVSLLIMSCLNAFLSMACCVGLLLAISLTIMDTGRNLIIGCNSTVLPADGRASTHNCPFDTTRIYDTTLALWFPSMLMAALEAVISVRFFIVGMILRGIGPCGQTYFRERVITF